MLAVRTSSRSRPGAVLAVALAYAFGASCRGNEGDVRPVARSSQASGASGTRVKNRVSDSLRIARYLNGQHLTLVTFGDRGDGFYAVIARGDSAGTDLVLVALRLLSDSLIPLEHPLSVGEYGPTLVRWVKLGGSEVDGLLITHDHRSEGIIGTAVYAITAGWKLRLSFADGSDVCKPAELRDLDADGKPELLSYPEDPSGGDCTSDCHLELAERFQMNPSWVQVWKWTGVRWAPAERDFPQFYRDLARRYQELDSVITRGVEYDVCRRTPWLMDAHLFQKWASRAQRFAGAH